MGKYQPHFQRLGEIGVGDADQFLRGRAAQRGEALRLELRQWAPIGRDVRMRFARSGVRLVAHGSSPGVGVRRDGWSGHRRTCRAAPTGMRLADADVGVVTDGSSPGRCAGCTRERVGDCEPAAMDVARGSSACCAPHSRRDRPERQDASAEIARAECAGGQVERETSRCASQLILAAHPTQRRRQTPAWARGRTHGGRLESV
jgi:hypothetical protein